MPRKRAAPAALAVWCMTTGEAGTRQQARGLAQALSPDAEERLIRVSRLWALQPSALRRLAPPGVTLADGAPLAAPWPDVLVTCGRRSALAALAIRRANPQPMALIHIQPPPRPEAFDLVVALPHDRLSGRNVIRVDTALHGVTRAALARAAAAGDTRLAGLPRPWTGVLLGGSRRRAPFTAADAHRLANGLDLLRAQIGGSLVVTPSRRTPATVVAALERHWAGDPTALVWDGEPPNPYLAILSLCERLVVTGDSISMISEALATTAQVLVFPLGAGRRHAEFVESLRGRGLVAWLGEAPATRPRPPADSGPIVVAAVQEVVAAKLGRRGLGWARSHKT